MFTTMECTIFVNIKCTQVLGTTLVLSLGVRIQRFTRIILGGAMRNHPLKVDIRLQVYAGHLAWA